MLRPIPARARIPLVFVTGFDDQVKEKLRANAFARRPEHLVKPIEGAQLTDKIHALLGEVNDRPVRILMADDEADFLGAVSRALARRGIEVSPVSDGRAAVQAASRGGFDANVLDVRMPVLDGIDALREIRAADPDTPVLLLTGHADLDKAYEQLLLYRDALKNPPLLVVSDIDHIVIRSLPATGCLRTLRW